MSDAALLLENVRRSVAGTLDVLGTIGIDAGGKHVLLAREQATNALVGIAVTANPRNAEPLSVEVERTLNKTVMVSGSRCPECRTPLPELDAFCFHCGADLSGATAASGSRESDIVLQALESATAGRYEVLGRLDREGSTSAVYFARDIENGEIAALRLKRVDAGEAAKPEYVQRLTQVFDTAELHAKIAQRKAQQNAERAAAEHLATERAAAARIAAQLADAERAAAERAATERAAAERSAAEHAAAERAAAERAATERAAVERAATERAAAATILPTAEEPRLSSDTASPLATYDAPAIVEPNNNIPQQKSGKRTPLIAVAVVALLAVVGYVAFRGGNTTPTVVAAAPPAVDSVVQPVVAPLPVDTAAATPPPTTETPTNGTTTTAIGPDSGIIRISGLPSDARVTVDGRAMRGRVLRVTARAHEMVVTAKGFDPYTEKVSVASGATRRWAPELVAVVVAAIPDKNAALPPAPTNAPAAVNKKTCRELVRVEDWSAAQTTCTAEANAGNGAAASSLGRMYAKGLGVARNPATSIIWYKKGVEGGDRDAQSAMGYALREGAGVKRDEKESARLFKLAAEAGDKAAQLEYAVALEKGDGLPKDQAAARVWYKKSADQGIYMAARRLGHMFEKGDGGPKNEADALAAYQQAATLGDAESAMTAGKWYREGRGVTASPAQALIWYKKALALGNKDAQSEIDKLQK